MNPFIIGEKVYLRAVETTDAELIASTENNPEARITLYYATPSTIESHKNRIIQRQSDTSAVHLAICDKQQDIAVGCTSLVRIDWVGRMATFYIAIATSDNQSKGFGSETLKLILDYAFNTLNLNRIQLHVSIDNPRAVRVYEKCGFKIEGTLRQAMFFNGKYHDFYLMAILREDYTKV